MVKLFGLCCFVRILRNKDVYRSQGSLEGKSGKVTERHDRFVSRLLVGFRFCARFWRHKDVWGRQDFAEDERGNTERKTYFI